MSFIKKKYIDSRKSKQSEPKITFNVQDFEFILKTLQTANIGLRDLEQAVNTIGKLQEKYKSLLNQQN
jgi:hypothetical protein